MVATCVDGSVNIYDAGTGQRFSKGTLGEHTTNTAAAIVKHPSGKAILLCGQATGRVTAYDLPDITPRNTFVTGHEDSVTSIADMGADGLFTTCGLSGGVVIWRWESARS